MALIDYKAIGNKIREARKEQGLSQEQLAEVCGISASFLGHIERGTRKMSLDTLVILSSELKTSTDYLLMDQIPTNTQSLSVILNDAQKRVSKEQFDRLNSSIRALISSADIL